MNKLNLKMKLGLGFGVLLVLMMVLGICGYRSAVTADKLSEEVDKVANKKELALMVEASLEMQSNGARGFLLTGKEDMLGRDEEGKAKEHACGFFCRLWPYEVLLGKALWIGSTVEGDTCAPSMPISYVRDHIIWS